MLVSSSFFVRMKGETCKSSRSARVNRTRFSETIAASISNTTNVSVIKQPIECYTIFRKRYIDVLPLCQAQGMSSQKVCVLHDWINLDMCFESHRKRRSPFTLEASIGDEEERLRGYPCGGGGTHLIPKRERSFGGIVEYVDINLFCRFAFLRGDCKSPSVLSFTNTQHHLSWGRLLDVHTTLLNLHFFFTLMLLTQTKIFPSATS